MRQFVTRSEEETQRLGAMLALELRGGEIILLCGDLGVGKTQFAKGVARGLGVTEEILSPTFTMKAEYVGRLPLVHYDLYRIERAEELQEIGFLESDEVDAVSLVEWGDRVAVSPEMMRIEFHLRSDKSRCLEFHEPSR